MTEDYTEGCGDIHDYRFRTIRTRKIRFSVKAERDVGICLSPEPDNLGEMYQIHLGDGEGSESAIKFGREDDLIRMDTPDILSVEEYCSFWIKFQRGVIKVGKKGHLFAFMKFEVPEKLDIRYYGYSTRFDAVGEWIFPDGEDDSSSSSSESEMSSSDSEAEDLNSMETRPIMYKRPARWVYCGGGYMPHHPVSGGEGTEGEIYVGMAKHEGGHILGAVNPNEGLCHIPFGGEDIPKEEYYILSNPGSVSLEWKPGSAGLVPSGALEGGYTEDQESLYIGRVLVDGVVSVGKVHPSHGVCYVPYGGAEHSHRDYEVLCAKNLPCRMRE